MDASYAEQTDIGSEIDCVDIDECRIPSSGSSLFATDCKANSYCINMHGSYECVCNEGLGNSNSKQYSVLLTPIFLITGGFLKCPKKYVQEIFCTWWHLHKFLKCPKIEQFQFFSFFSVRKLITCLIFEMPHFFKLKIFKSIQTNIDSKVSHFKN